MKKLLFKTLLLIYLLASPTLVLGQNTGFNLSLMDDVDFQNFLTDINLNNITDLNKYYDGSVYLFKEPVEGMLHFWNTKSRKAKALVNLNIQRSSFDFDVNGKTFRFSAKELSEVVINGVSYVPNNNGVFYKLIFENDTTRVIEEFRLEIQEQSHITGYESKKNDVLKIKKSTFLEVNGTKTPFSRTKKGVSKLFGSKSNKVKSFINTANLSPKSDADLARIMSEFNK